MTSKEILATTEVPRSVKPKRKPVVAKVRLLNAVTRIAVAPDDDISGWRNQMKEILATASPLFVEFSLKQLLAAARLPGEMVPSTASLSGALELVASLQPENEAQAALAISYRMPSCRILECLEPHARRDRAQCHRDGVSGCKAGTGLSRRASKPTIA